MEISNVSMKFGWCLLYILWTSLSVLSTTVDETSVSALPDAIRQSPSSIVRVVNISSASAFQEEAIANATSNLSNTSFTDIENDNVTHALQLRYRERKKQERIIRIRNQILTRLHMDRQPNISASIFSDDEQMKIAQFMERLQHRNSEADSMPSDGVYFNTMQWLQSFYPSCSVPNNTDKSSWENTGSFRILYDVPFGRHSPDITILMAKLRLYKIIGSGDPNFVRWDSSRSRLNMLDGLVNNRAANGINVNIYQYFKPLRVNKREKKRLVDSRTISVDYKGWVDFNVMSSLNYWFRHSNKNYGLSVEVEDSFGNKLNPNFYFQNMNCSTEVASMDPPFPNIMEIHREVGKNESSLFDNETYPTLDLRTAEIPRDIAEFEVIVDSSAKERVVKKKKRSAEVEPEDTCVDEMEYVEFSEVGLDEYILWPQGVLWRFCDGSCEKEVSNTPEKNREYFFSVWLQRFFKLKRKSPENDCIVTSRESLPVILYYGDNQIVETVLEDFVPTSCGCRAS